MPASQPSLQNSCKYIRERIPSKRTSSPVDGRANIWRDKGLRMAVSCAAAAIHYVQYSYCRTMPRVEGLVDNYNYDNNHNAFVFGEFSTLEGAAGSGC